jgi:ribosomal protein L28
LLLFLCGCEQQVPDAVQHKKKDTTRVVRPSHGVKAAEEGKYVNIRINVSFIRDVIEFIQWFFFFFLVLVVAGYLWFVRRQLTKRPRPQQEAVSVPVTPFVGRPGKGAVLSMPAAGGGPAAEPDRPREIQRLPKLEKTLSFSNIQGVGPGPGKWFVVGASSIGRSHITEKKPCQDNHYCITINDGLGVAVVCDGAGTAENSDLGSAFVARRTCEHLKALFAGQMLAKRKWLPSDGEWREAAELIFKKVYNELSDFAHSRGVDFASVACTVIVVVYTPYGLLSAHIGDGRAGYCTEGGEWRSLMKPHKGSESNLTVFITSRWMNAHGFLMSDVPVPETRVIGEKAVAFMLLSDGCEAHSFDCSKIDAETGKWFDPNLPSEKFFNPLVGQLRTMHAGGAGMEDANSLWRKFLEEGAPGLRDETDDKTMIFGILI